MSAGESVACPQAAPTDVPGFNWGPERPSGLLCGLRSAAWLGSFPALVPALSLGGCLPPATDHAGCPSATNSPFFSRPSLTFPWQSACRIGRAPGGEEIYSSPWWGRGNGGLLSPSGSPGPGPAEQPQTSHSWRLPGPQRWRGEEFVSKEVVLGGRWCPWMVAGWWREAGMGRVPPGDVQVRPPLLPGCRNSGVCRRCQVLGSP